MHQASKRALFALVAAAAFAPVARPQPLSVDPEDEHQAVRAALHFLNLADEQGMAEARKLIADPELNGTRPPTSTSAREAHDAYIARDQMAPMGRRKLVSATRSRSRPPNTKHSGPNSPAPLGPSWTLRFVSEGAKVGAVATRVGLVFEGRYCVEEVVVRFDDGRGPAITRYMPLPTTAY